MTKVRDGEPWTVRAAAATDLGAAMALRHAVFCVEQGVPEELERDDHDATALHLVAVADGVVVGTCRLVIQGDAARLGRMAVARSHRGRGVGADLLGAAHREARAAGVTEVELHSQLPARDFYAQAGYAAQGDEFEEAGIAHVVNAPVAALTVAVTPTATPTDLPLHQVDAFAERPFAGNPAAVCLLAEEADPAWMQSVAQEMNLSETAFLLPEGPPGAYGLRWFTPVVEVDLCGHATLASAHVLWSTGAVAPDAPVSFSTRSGTLTAARDGALIAMDFPAAVPEPADPPPGLVEALGVAPAWVGRTLIGWFVEVSTPEEVAGAAPDMARLAAVPGQGVILNAGGGIDGADVTSRYFAPAAGIPEDPVTGSAHCALGPYWAERLGRTRLVCHQASRRGGIVYVEAWGERVGLAGRAVTVMEGRLTA